MEGEATAAQRIKRVGEALLEREEETYELGGLSTAFWEEIMQENVLGKIAVSGAIARAIVAQKKTWRTKSSAKL